MEEAAGLTSNLHGVGREERAVWDCGGEERRTGFMGRAALEGSAPACWVWDRRERWTERLRPIHLPPSDWWDGGEGEAAAQGHG